MFSTLPPSLLQFTVKSARVKLNVRFNSATKAKYLSSAKILLQVSLAREVKIFTKAVDNFR